MPLLPRTIYSLLLCALLLLSCKPNDDVRLRTGKLEHRANRMDVFVFDGAAGPEGQSVVQPEGRTSWTSYQTSGISSLALFITDTNSGWLSLAHGLKSIGIPFTTCTSVDEAAKHRVILIYPALTRANGNLTAPLEHFVEGGGTVIADNVEDDSFSKIFGFSHVAMSLEHEKIRFGNELAAKCFFTDPRELEVPFANKLQPDLYHRSYEYPGATAVAAYENGATAVTETQIGKGTAYAIGTDLGYLFQLGYNNREEQIARAYVNQYEPTIDVWLRMIQRLYRDGEPNAVTLWPVPHNRDITVLMTHDIDYRFSLPGALVYARYEDSVKVPSTYYIQAKYIKDYNDSAFVDSMGAFEIRELDRMHMEIASHSVSHSRQFAKFPEGTGREQYPSYLPFVQTADTTLNGTVLGELRASKYLLEQIVGHSIVGFRPGFLSKPRTLSEDLTATGYAYSSSATANNMLTHLPFQINYDDGVKQETPIFSFPITIEDRERPLMDQRLDKALALASQLRKYGGCYCILLHPDKFDYKWRFEQGFVAAVQPYAYFTTVAAYGDFWAARNAVTIDANQNTITLTIPKAIDGLTLELPAGRKLQSTSPSVTSRQEGNRVILGPAHGTVTLHLN